MPTESRTRLGGTANGASAVDACVIRAGCSIRLSTPPRLSASFQIFVRPTSATASSSLADEERDHAAEVAHLRRGELVARVRRQAGVEHLLDARLALEVARRPRPRSRSASPCGRRASSRPRRTSQQSNGPGTAPSDFWRNARRSEIASSFVARKPPTTSECPPRYFVVECRTTSAPSESGCWRYGVAKVLSTTTSAPTACAASAAARMSTRFRSGFVGDSSQTRRVPLLEVLAEAGRDLLRGEEREAVPLRLVHLREHPVDARRRRR